MFKSNKLAVLAALLSLLMLISAFAIPAFAEETEAPTEAVTTVGETEAATEPESDGETEAATKAESDKETGSEAATTGKKEETTTVSASEKAEAEAKKQQRTRGYINLGVGAAFLIALAILCIKFRDKIPTWWKGLKSECGKITWCPKDKLIKNVKVVILIILAIAIAIGVLDFVFSRGMILLGELFH